MVVDAGVIPVVDGLGSCISLFRITGGAAGGVLTLDCSTTIPLATCDWLFVAGPLAESILGATFEERRVSGHSILEGLAGRTVTLSFDFRDGLLPIRELFRFSAGCADETIADLLRVFRESMEDLDSSPEVSPF
jgi:hypothetical protein